MNSQFKVDANDVIDELLNSIAMKEKDIAILRSQIKALQKENEILNEQLPK